MTVVRIAPSPTGIPHIGNTRTALFNYLFAKKTNGKFILRIEDTDRNRIVEGAEEAIEEILRWLGINYDEKFVQSERIELYKKKVEELIEKGLAYNEDNAVRFRMPKTGQSKWIDLVGDKNIVFENENQEDFIILKSDGYPTYHLANVIDDHDMGVTHVIRGDEWISSTPKHIQLYEAFGWSIPEFAHLPVILGPDKSKLSKRHGALSVLDYKKEGYMREAIINYMALLGWSPKNDNEFFKLKDLEEQFSIKNVNTGSPIFDLNKLKWINSLHLRNMADLDLKDRLVEFDIRNKPILDHPKWKEIIEISKSRIELLSDFYLANKPFFIREPIDNENKELKNEIREALLSISEWRKDDILSKLILLMKEKGIRFPVLYENIIGVRKGLPLADMFEILGKDLTISLLEN